MIMEKSDAVAEFTDEELDGLSNEEREALGETPADVETLRELVDEDDDGDPGPEPQSFAPRYVAPPVEKFDEKMAAFDQEDVDAAEKFKAADLELDELLAKQRETEGKRTALREAKLKHEISVEQSQQAAEQEWRRGIQTFFARTKRTEGIDYRGNKSLNAALDQAVKDLGNAKDKDGNYVNADKSGAWFLKEAHRQVTRDAGLAGQGGEAADEHADDRREAMGKADFERLDDLAGLDLEDEVAKMTPEEEDRWLRAGS